ncbi:hypothetical protein FRX31_016965 [Thalictrum thalictroides]|uniref:F-box domain-containing protein n=1 Tax=Thalictrum thalictroides TaxID=46969 RepID=A0A7J6WA42_THATH|nr:hypothetical protein FRX31_016965 [Thalictrum thalictroides]
MESLTQDITVDILSRLPICSLICCRCVCKTWRTIISDPSFFTFQQQHFPFFDLFFQCICHSESGRRSEECSQVSNFYLAFGNEDNLKEDDERDFRLILRPCKEVHVPFIIDLQKGFNGFLVVSTKSVIFFPSDPICVFNPITREQLQLPCIQISPEFGVVKKFLSGFGFDDFTQEFKFVILFFYVLRCTDVFESKSEMHVYSFRSNTWRKETGNVPNVLLNTYQVFSYVFANRSLYWAAIDIDNRFRIVSLHLGSEDFGEIQMPDLLMLEENTSKQSHNFALGLLEKCLSLVDYSHKNFINIWQMKNDNGNDYWIKLFFIDIHHSFSLQARSVMCLEYGKNPGVLFTMLKAAHVKTFVVADVDGYFRAIPFVGCLFSNKALGMM